MGLFRPILHVKAQVISIAYREEFCKPFGIGGTHQFFARRKTGNPCSIMVA